MQRRGESDQPVKGQSTDRPKAQKAPIAQVSTADLQEQLDRRTRELDEAFEQQTATAEILERHQQLTHRYPTGIRVHCSERAEALSGRPRQRRAQVRGHDQRRGRRRAGSCSRRSVATHNFPYPPRAELHAWRSLA